MRMRSAPCCRAVTKRCPPSQPPDSVPPATVASATGPAAMVVVATMVGLSADDCDGAPSVTAAMISSCVTAGAGCDAPRAVTEGGALVSRHSRAAEADWARPTRPAGRPEKTEAPPHTAAACGCRAAVMGLQPGVLAMMDTRVAALLWLRYMGLRERGGGDGRRQGVDGEGLGGVAGGPSSSSPSSSSCSPSIMMPFAHPHAPAVAGCAAVTAVTGEAAVAGVAAVAAGALRSALRGRGAVVGTCMHQVALATAEGGSHPDSPFLQDGMGRRGRESDNDGGWAHV